MQNIPGQNTGQNIGTLYIFIANLCANQGHYFWQGTVQEHREPMLCIKDIITFLEHQLKTYKYKILCICNKMFV